MGGGAGMWACCAPLHSVRAMARALPTLREALSLAGRKSGDLRGAASDRALADQLAMYQLEPLLKMPCYLSPGWLRIDPTFDRLRKNSRFQKLAEGTA